MDNVKTIRQLETLALLGDPQRLAIMRSLMEQAATLTQLADAMGSYPAKVRHHLKKLENAGLIQLTATQVVGGYVEKYYRATAQAYIAQTIVTPAQSRPDGALLMGSHDPVLDSLTQQLAANKQAPTLFVATVGSLDGLIAMRQGLCQLAGCHLLDDDGRDFNISYIRHLFPGQSMSLLTLAYRQQGLLVAPGNPRQIHSLADLARPDMRFINRQPGAGTRVWLERQLAQMGIDAAQINGYGRIATTHYQVATAVAAGQADVGLAVLAAAQSRNLDFIPLFAERYELAMPATAVANPALQPLFDRLQTAAFRQTIAEFGGYESTHTGARRDVG